MAGSRYGDDAQITGSLQVSGSATFNEEGDDEDFRIESDNRPYAFYVDGATDSVGIACFVAPSHNVEIHHEGADGDEGIMIIRYDGAVYPDNILGGIGFDSADGNRPSRTTEASAFIAGYASEHHGTGDKGGYLVFGTAPDDQDDDTTTPERVRITSAGKVGIGTDDPAGALEVNASTAIIRIDSATGTHGKLEWAEDGTRKWLIYNDYSDDNLTFKTNNDVRMVIEQDGNIGIGTSNPGTLLDVNGTFSATGVSLSNNDAGSSNTVFGLNAGANIASGGNFNLLMGENAGNDLTIGDDNVIIGYNTVVAATTTSGIVVIGSGAGAALAASSTAADGTVLIGYQAGAAITSGIGNVAVGQQALGAEDDGDYNTAIGAGALVSQTGVSGETSNTAVGYAAANRLTTGIKNVIMGSQAALNTDDVDEAIIIGYGAGTADLTSDADGTIIIGTLAGSAITSGAENTVVGYEALKTEDAGDGCTAVGYKALSLQNVDSAKNTAVGAAAGQLVNTSVQSTYIGFEAGKGAGANKPTGAGNTFVGYQAGTAHSHDAQDNTMVGHQAGDGLTQADGNTGVGSAVVFATDQNNQTAIGYAADTSGLGPNSVKIGNGSVSRANVQVDWTIDSDERIKQDIEDNALGLSFINDLSPRKYRKLHPADWAEEIREERYKTRERDEFDDAKVWDGLIAQEVKEAVDKSGTTFSGWSVDTNGKQGIQYSALVVPLIKAVQELSAEFESLKTKIETLENS